MDLMDCIIMSRSEFLLYTLLLIFATLFACWGISFVLERIISK